MKADGTEVLALARHDLACYAIALWPTFEFAAHHRLIVEKLEAVERGEISRLMVFMPPRHGKSLIATQLFPAWFLGRHPEFSVITACYGQSLADSFGHTVRNLVRDSLHSAIFGASRLSHDAMAANAFTTSVGGSYHAVGRGGPITGRGAHLFIIDDPLKDREEAQSETVRRSLHEWYSSVAYTRLQPGGAVVLVQTRWHEDDLAGHLLRKHSDEWVVLSFPAIAESDEGFRRAGEALWPQRYSLQELERIRIEVGAANFVSLYQQRPSASTGTVFRRDWWRRYHEPPTCKWIVHSWDTAFKTGAANDFSVCTIWGVTDTGYYLLWAWRGRVEFPELKKRMGSLAAEWRPSQILVEDAASGQSLIQELRYSTALPITPVKVDKDKLARAQAVTPLIEAGKVFLPESAAWVNDYVDELASFPTGTYDDYVDSTTQALHHIRHRPINTIRITPLLM